MISADIILKIITILKELRIAQLCYQNVWTLACLFFSEHSRIGNFNFFLCVDYVKTNQRIKKVSFQPITAYFNFLVSSEANYLSVILLKEPSYINF